MTNLRALGAFHASCDSCNNGLGMAAATIAVTVPRDETHTPDERLVLRVGALPAPSRRAPSRPSRPGSSAIARCGAAGEDSQAVPTQPAVERSRWDDQKDQQDWAPSMEEGGRLSSTGPRRERVLPVQVDSRRSTSTSDSRSASCRIGACVPRAQSNDRAWSTRVVRDRSVTNLRVGALGASFDLRNNAL